MDDERKAEFDGKCAFAVSFGKFDTEGDPEVTLERDGKTYQFAFRSVRFVARLLPGVFAKAHARWNER